MCAFSRAIRVVTRRLLVVAWCAGLAATDLRGEDWPRWGGPRADETWHGPKLRSEWPVDGLLRLWTRKLGGGYGGVAAVDSRVYVLDRQTTPTERERLLCCDAANGRELWVSEQPVAYGQLDYGNGPRSTPTVDAGLIFTLGAVGHLACCDAVSGRQIWKHDLRKTHAARIPTWGLAASPVVWRDLVIVHPGGADGCCLVAFDRRTGEERWRTGDDPAGYATPVFVEAPSGPLLICWTPEHILGVDPRDGSPMWKVPYKVTYGVSIATPIFHENLVFVSGYWEGSKAIRLGKDARRVELAWEENKFLRGLMAQPIYRAGHGYTIDKQFGLTCFELATGTKLWDCGHKVVERGRNPQATLTWIDEAGEALLFNENGDLILARLSSAGYEELARSRLLQRCENAPLWAHPAYAGNQVFVRSDTELAGFELPVAP